jgi:hypothetical protein
MLLLQRDDARFGQCQTCASLLLQGICVWAIGINCGTSAIAYAFMSSATDLIQLQKSQDTTFPS